MYKMKTMPWEHQLKALDYLMVRNFGALYTDMGTGKTKIMIDLICNRGFNTTLIVGTKKSCDVWVDEIEIHASQPILPVKLWELSTPNKISKVMEKMAEQAISHQKMIFIVNYDSIWRKPFSEFLLKQDIDCVICDESHRIKTPSSKCSLYLQRLGRRVNHRFMMTGTPTDKPIDVYAQYRFLQPNIFGTNFYKFRERYENLDAGKTAYAGYRVLKADKPYRNLDELKKKMYSCAFYAESPLELPEVTEVTLKNKIEPKTWKIYQELDKEGVLDFGKDGVLETNNALTKALRERELLSGYLTLEDEAFTKKYKYFVNSQKKDMLYEFLEDLPKGERVVVFCNFRWEFNGVFEAVQKLGLRYGEISGKRDDYTDWKQNNVDVIAVQYTSGSESISLVEARYCVFFSLCTSYTLYQQARKRVHRPKQTKPVTYFHTVLTAPKGLSVDQKIIKALSLKQDLADYLLKENTPTV